MLFGKNNRMKLHTLRQTGEGKFDTPALEEGSICFNVNFIGITALVAESVTPLYLNENRLVLLLSFFYVLWVIVKGGTRSNVSSCKLLSESYTVRLKNKTQQQ